MIDFEAKKTAIRAIVASLTGVTAGAVVFEDEPRPMADPAQGAIVLISFFGVVSLGSTDERVYERDTSAEYGQGGDTSEIPEGGQEPPALETVVGRREVTIRVKVETIYQDANRDARFYLERMRTRIAWSSIQDRLTAAGLGFQDVALATLIGETRDNRKPSIAVFDVRANVLATEQDPYLWPTIERVDVSRGAG